MIPNEEAKKLKDRIKELEEPLEKKDKELEKTKNELKETEKEFEEFKAMHAKTVANLQKALKIKSDKKKQAKPLGAPKYHKG